jgi:iron complex outermembrane receptor protein
VEYRDNAMPTASGSGGRIAYSNLAPSAMWNWQATPKLSLNAAGRMDYLSLRRSGPFPVGLPRADNRLFDQHFTEISGNLGAVFKATDVDTLRVTYARGVQAPGLVGLGGIELIVPQYGFAILGNPNLRPAIVTNYEIAYDRAFPQVNAKITAKLFGQRTVDVQGVNFLFDIAPTATTLPGALYVNIGHSEMWGAELSAQGRLGSGYHWSADASYTDVTDQPFAGRDLVAAATAYASTSPKYRGNAALGWSDDHWAVDGYLHVVGKFNGYDNPSGLQTTLGIVPTYATFAGRIAYQTSDDVVISLNGQNLLRARQAQSQSSGLRAERRMFASISKSW